MSKEKEKRKKQYGLAVGVSKEAASLVNRLHKFSDDFGFLQYRVVEAALRTFLSLSREEKFDLIAKKKREEE